MGQRFLEHWANSASQELYKAKAHNQREMFGTGPGLAISFYNPYDPTFF